MVASGLVVNDGGSQLVDLCLHRDPGRLTCISSFLHLGLNGALIVFKLNCALADGATALLLLRQVFVRSNLMIAAGTERRTQAVEKARR